MGSYLSACQDSPLASLSGRILTLLVLAGSLKYGHTLVAAGQGCDPMHCIYHALFVSQGGMAALSSHSLGALSACARAQDFRERSSGRINGEEGRVCCSGQRVVSSQQLWPCQVLEARVWDVSRFRLSCAR